MELFIYQTMGHCLILTIETQIVFEASRLPNTAHKQAENMIKSRFSRFNFFLKEIRLHNALKTDRKSYILRRLRNTHNPNASSFQDREK